MFYNKFKPASLMNNTYKNNTALYGNDFASYPSKLVILNSTNQWSSALVSGQLVDDDLVIGLLD